jgi:ferric iron reductase protein FhuF
MYLNSQAAYDEPVPSWLLRVTMLRTNRVLAQEEKEAIEEKDKRLREFIEDDEEQVEVRMTFVQLLR